jgi:hypothetical protein
MTIVRAQIPDHLLTITGMFVYQLTRKSRSSVGAMRDDNSSMIEVITPIVEHWVALREARE